MEKKAYYLEIINPPCWHNKTDEHAGRALSILLRTLFFSDRWADADGDDRQLKLLPASRIFQKRCCNN